MEGWMQISRGRHVIASNYTKNYINITFACFINICYHTCHDLPYHLLWGHLQWSIPLQKQDNDKRLSYALDHNVCDVIIDKIPSALIATIQNLIPKILG